jgi:cellobiose phosphorylase
VTVAKRYTKFMDTPQIQLTPEMQAALLAKPGEPLHIADEETRRVYLLVEQGVYPELEEEYIRAGLEMARNQIARGEISQASIEEVIAKAKKQQARKT